MNNTFTKEELRAWIAGLMEAAKNDEQFDVAWFKPTENSPFAIIGGWRAGNLAGTFDDLFCTSKSEPAYVMCVKICKNEGPYSYADYEILDMPLDKFGEVDNTELTLEWQDDPAALATFFMMEWERFMEGTADEEN